MHDCLRIASSLLEANASSCRFFRESGSLMRVPSLLALPAGHQRGHATTATLACQLLSCLLAGGGGARNGAPSTTADAAGGDGASTQAELLRLRVLPLLLFLCTDAATATDPALRLQALGTLAELVQGNAQAADELLAERLARRSAGGELTSESALHRLLYTGARPSSGHAE